MNTLKKIVNRIFKKQWEKSYSELEKLPSPKQRFEKIYKENLWRNGESLSGSGSTLKFTKNIREALPIVIDELNLKSILDAPCGDLNWMRLILPNLNIKYTGADIVQEIIDLNQKKYSNNNVNFIQLDLIKDVIPETDMLFCRDCLFHLSYEDTFSVFNNFVKSKTKYLFTTTYDKKDEWENGDIVTGYFRAIDLTKAPYFLPSETIYSVKDGKPDTHERFMKIWTNDQIREALPRMKSCLKI